MSISEVRVSRRTRFAIVGLGLIANKAFVYGWNFGVYPAVLVLGGPIYGSLLMFPLNFGANYGTLRLYDWSGKDWLGIETIKEVREYHGPRLIGRVLSRALNAPLGVAVVVLSLVFDPFITTAYLRHGAHLYDGLSRRDWRIFLASFMVGTSYWVALVLLGIKAIELL